MPRKRVFERNQNFHFWPILPFGPPKISIFHKGRKDASRSGSAGGLYESQKFKNGQHVFKQPKTIIESPPSAATVGTTPVLSAPVPPPGVPKNGPSGALGGPCPAQCTESGGHATKMEKGYHTQ